MASTINIDAYSDALVVLGTAGIVVPIVRRWGLNPILGYLSAGAILGPLGLGSFTKSLPFLYWLTIADAQSVAGIAELGVVFLLFLIGLGLSFQSAYDDAPARFRVWAGCRCCSLPRCLLPSQQVWPEHRGSHNCRRRPCAFVNCNCA